MIKKGSLYSSTDKALFDALCQHKMSKSSLQELFWTRGIIKPNKLDKEDIAKYFSRLNHDYFDHKFISDVISTGSHKERHTLAFTHTAHDISDIEKHVKDLVSERNGIDNSIDFNMVNKTISIEVAYSYYDYTKPEFKQLVSKTALISIESTSEGLAIRAPDNSYVKEITETLISKLDASTSESGLEVETINLFGIDSVDARIQFFENLISKLEGFELYDVSDVSVFNPTTGAEDEVGVRVKKASLNGEGILKSGELKQFYKKGFFVYKISWSMIETGVARPDIYNFQAQFNDPELCLNFAYLAKGCKRYLEKGEYAKDFSPLSAFEEIRMTRKLEKSARAAKKIAFSVNTEGSSEIKE